MPARFDPATYVEDLRGRLLPSGIRIELRESSSPGGDQENIAHTHALPVLNDFLIEYDPSTERKELRLSLTHEVLHVAFRHVGSAITVVRKTAPLIADVLEQALEEDIEEHARAMVAR